MCEGTLVDGLLVACVGSSDGALVGTLVTGLRVGSSEGDFITVGDVDGTLLRAM